MMQMTGMAEHSCSRGVIHLSNPRPLCRGPLVVNLDQARREEASRSSMTAHSLRERYGRIREWQMPRRPDARKVLRFYCGCRQMILGRVESVRAME